MGDQRPLFPFWFGSSATTRVAAAPPAAPTSAPTLTVDTQNAGQLTAATARRPSRSSSIDIAIMTASSPSAPTSPTPTEHRAPDQPHSAGISPKTPTAGNVQVTIFASPLPSSLPGLPHRASRPHSPSPPTQNSPKQVPNNSDKGGQPISPSKESRTTIQEPTVAADKERPHSAVSEQESQAKLGTEYEGDNAEKGKAIKGASLKHDAVEAMSSISSQIATTTNVAGDPETTTASQTSEPPIVRGEHKTLTESDEKPEVKEVVQETNTEANEEIKTEACEFIVPKSGHEAENNEKTEIPKQDQMQNQKQDDSDTKEMQSASFPMVKPANNVAQPKKRSTISDGLDKSVPPGGDHSPLQNDIINYISKFVNQIATRDLKNFAYDKPVSLITLSGENNGALMKIGPDPSEREDPVRVPGGYNTRCDQSMDAAPDRDGVSTEKRMDDTNTAEDQPEAYVNNNAQGINNSIVFDGSITERSPGVHMAVVTHVIKEPTQSADKTSSTEI